MKRKRGIRREEAGSDIVQTKNAYNVSGKTV